MRNRQRIRRYFRKGLGCLLSLLVYCLSPGVGQAVFANTEQSVQDVIAKTSGEEQIREQWKMRAVELPASGELIPAGYIQVTWRPLTGTLRKILAYRVYLDEMLCEEIDAGEEEMFSCEVYTTKTASHQVKIEAVLEGDYIVTSDIRTFFVSKKGVGIPNEAKVISQDMGASWYYNWSSKPDLRVKSDLTFVPMIWSGYPEGINWLGNPENRKYRTVLGYNEPDRSDQANMTPAVAAANQTYFSSSGLRIGSPAVSTFPTGSGWFKEYAEQVNMDEIDFIAFHCYPGWTDGKAEAFLKDLDRVYETYHKPIWITELAIARWDGDFLWFNGKDEGYNQKVREFMQNLIKGLEEREYVERYAWQQFDLYDWAGGSSCLYDQYTGILTTLGSLYRSCGNPEGYVLPKLDGTASEQEVVDIPVQDPKIPEKEPVPIENPYGDVREDDWFYSEVMTAYKQGLMTGTGPKLFSPCETLSRAQFALILYRLEGMPEAEYDGRFFDVDEDLWYTDADAWASQHGIVMGYGESRTFGPGDCISREQMAAMMYRYAEYKGYDLNGRAELSGYQDGKSVSVFAKDAVAWAVEKEIIHGKCQGTRLDPQGNTTRAEAAVILARFVGTYAV